GNGKNNIQVHVDKGKVVEISGPWKQQRDLKANDWKCGHWWENGYVRRLEMPEDADWKNIQAFIYNDIFLEIQIPKFQKGFDHAQGKGVA
ncbi:class VI heat shock protein, partial [Trifolium pratense]